MFVALSHRGLNLCGQGVNDNRLRELFENIIPYYNIPNQYVYYPPLIQLNTVQHSWRDVFSQNILNTHYGGKLNTDVDRIIGEAIWERIRRHTSIADPRPYQFQIEAIVTGLNILDTIRGALRSGRPRTLPSFIPNPSVIAVLAPTGGGKTEVFEALTLQIAFDAHRGGLRSFTKAIIIYPMKAFMIEHFRRFVEDLTYINAQTNSNLSIGILDGDTPDSLDENELLTRLSYLLGSNRCPLCNSDLNVRGSTPYYIIECSRNQQHKLHVRIAKDMIFQHPPDILLTTIDSFNYILLEQNRHVLLGGPSKYSDPRRLPPLILALDEPHVYTGVFGSNVSLILRAFEYTVQEYARRFGIKQYRPLKIVASATMPHADEFLARLFAEDIRNIRIITSPTNQVGLQSHKGFVAFLPLREIHKFGFESAVVEMVPLIAAILPKNYRKIIVFVDSVEFAERLKRYMEDYIHRGLPDYRACRHLFQPDVYDPSTGRFNPNAIKAAVHTSHIPRTQREEIEEGIRSTPPQYNIVIATPTLELGIDIGDITVVVIAGLPPTPEKFAQRAGRAGRRNPGMVIIIGNDTSAVDRYYLSDHNRTIRYLQLSLGATPQPTYMLPLNPVNLESIRRFTGNIMAIYADISNIWKIVLLQKYNMRILNDYLDLSIDRVVSSFSGSNYALLKNVASFASNIKVNLQGELMQRFQEIISEFGECTIPTFVAPGYARQRYFTGKIDFIPIIDNVRLSVRPIEIQHYTDVQHINVQPPRDERHKPHSREVNAMVALAYYGIRYIEPSNNPFHYFVLRIQDARRQINIGRKYRYINTLRGTLHYSSYRGDSYLFEVAGLFYSQLDALNKYNELRQSLEEFMRNINIIRNISLELDKELSRRLRSQGRYSITLKRIHNLIDAISAFLNISNQHSPHIVEPRVFYLLSPGILGRDSNHILHNMLMLKYASRTSLTPLDYFEVIPRRSRNGTKYWEFSKLFNIRCPNCRSNRIKLVEYDRSNLSLKLGCLQCKETFNFGGDIPQSFIDMIRTRPITYTIIIRGDPTIKKGLPNNPFELLFYRDLYAVFGNVGFRVSSLNKRVGRFKRTLSLRNMNEQYILGFRYRTQALELRIDWNMLMPLLNNIHIQRQVGIEYNSLGVSIPQNFNVRNDFIIRVTHTLSHLLINFAPIHTGGNRWDVNEYINFETDNQGNIVASSVIIFDSDEGGNGVSELIGYFIRDVLSDAVSEAARYYLRPHDALIGFLGEPGITLFGVWPICPYNNIALSRSLTLIFIQNLLRLSSLNQLTNLTANQLKSLVPSLQD